MDIEQQRQNMIKRQIQTWNVVDPGLLQVLAQTPREMFVPKQYEHLAFTDINIPVGHNMVMMTPKQEARVLQVLDIKKTDKILEIGTGVGYMTALLAILGSHVYSVDNREDFSHIAQNNLAAQGILNVDLIIDTPEHGLEKYAPYDVIVFTGSLPTLPQVFSDQLAQNGRMFIVLGDEPVMRATLFKNEVKKGLTSKIIFDTVMPALNFEKKAAKFDF